MAEALIGSSLFLSLTTMNSSSLEWNTPVSPCAEARAYPSYLPLVVRTHSWNSPLGTHHGSLVNIGGISLLTELKKTQNFTNTKFYLSSFVYLNSGCIFFSNCVCFEGSAAVFLSSPLTRKVFCSRLPSASH